VAEDPRDWSPYCRVGTAAAADLIETLELPALAPLSRLSSAGARSWPRRCGGQRWRGGLARQGRGARRTAAQVGPRARLRERRRSQAAELELRRASGEVTRSGRAGRMQAARELSAGGPI
jgi:hypothetical protein